MPDLCKLADLKAWLNIAMDQTTEDDQLTRLITAISDEFLSEIDRQDLTPAAAYTDIHRLGPHHFRSGNGGGYFGGVRESRPREIVIGLRHWPINSITSVTVDGTAMAQSTDGIIAGWFVDMSEDPEYRNTLKLIDSSLCPGRSVVSVVYNAGYAKAPKAVEQAAIEWAGFRYRSKAWIGQTSKHLSTGETINIQTTRMPESVAAVVKRYARPVEIL